MAMEHIDPPERPPEVVSELAGAELALPYLLESPDVAAFTRMAAGGVARARVAEPMLPLLAATLWSSREGLIPRGLAIVVDDDESAHALAEAAAPFLPGAPVAYRPSRGAGYGNGLEPAPHLVGERALALHALAEGGLVAVSADALIERVVARADRPPPMVLERGSEPGFDAVVEALASAGYER